MAKYKREGEILVKDCNIGWIPCIKGTQVWTIKLNGGEALHREDGPARIIFNNSKVDKEIYYINGLIHREAKPAYISYYESGEIMYEIWYNNNNCHRVEGPADIFYYQNGMIKSERYWIMNKRHREDGPSGISYFESGGINCKEYHIDGKYICHICYFTKEQDEIAFKKFENELSEWRNNELYK